jgi:hypothetical protein
LNACRVLAFWLCLMLWMPRPAGAQESGALRRFALVVAANDGGASRGRLKHALSDARAVAAVLRELGGVLETDATLLEQPRVEQLTGMFEALRARITALRAGGVRTELVFYYSGHSDEQGLLLAGAALSYRALRGLLDASAADVRVAILDSCASGAFTREKGGVRRAPFLFDASSAVRGHAFLTSSSESEAAQESDRLGGSFFTHYLVSGLRGAADASGDRKVTLTEAYRFAFDETLARTGQTQFGAQHPAYDIRLAGTGDLVLTDLRSTASELALAPELEGRLFVRGANDGVFLELYKLPDRPARIALPAARYTLELWRGRVLYRATVSTRSGQQAQLVTRDQFVAVEAESARPRGASYRRVPAAAALVASLGTNRLAGPGPVENGFNFALVYDRPDAVEGVQLAVGCARTRDAARGLQLGGACSSAGAVTGLQLSFVLNHVGVRSRVLQIAPLVNVAQAELLGAQVAALSWARRLHGVQLGLINLAGHADGVQLGVLNVTQGKARGVQLGVFNYASEADVAFGLLSITKQGGVHAVMQASDVALLGWALRLDAKYNYNFVAVGYHPWGGERHAGYSIGFGFGAKLPLWKARLWLEIDLGAHVVQRAGDWARGVPNTLYQLRGPLRFELHERFSVFAGPTFNLLLQLEPAERVRVGVGVKSRTATGSGDEARVAYWPGFAAGLRF